MPDCVTAKRQRNTLLLCVCVHVCVCRIGGQKKCHIYISSKFRKDPKKINLSCQHSVGM